MAEDIPIIKKVGGQEDLPTQTLKTLQSIEKLLKSTGATTSAYLPKDDYSSPSRGPSRRTSSERSKLEGFERATTDELKKEMFKTVLGPLRLVVEPMEEFFGIDLKKAMGSVFKKAKSGLTDLVTQTTEEERKTAKLKKDKAKEEFKRIQLEMKENQQALQRIGVDWRHSAIRDREGKFQSRKGMSALDIQEQLIRQNKRKFDERIENLAGTSKLSEKTNKLLGINKEEKDPVKKAQKGFKPTSSPSQNDLAKSEAGQAMLWFAGDQKRQNKRASTEGQGDGGGLLQSILGGGAGGLLGGAGGLLGKAGGALAKVGPVAAIAGGLIWMAMDAVQGYLNAEKWDVGKVSAAFGAFLGGTDKGWKGAGKGALQGALVGGGIGMMVGGPLGLVIGALLGAAVKAILGYIGGENIAKILDSFGKKKTMKTAQEEHLKDLDVLRTDYMESVKDIKSQKIDEKNTELVKKRDDQLKQLKELYGKNIEEEISKFNQAVKEGAYAEEPGRKSKKIDYTKYTKIEKFATGGIIKSPGYAMVHQDELIVPKSKLAKGVHGFDNEEVRNLVKPYDKKKEDKMGSTDIVAAINKLTDIMSKKDYNNIINNTDSSFDSSKIRTSSVYGV